MGGSTPKQDVTTTATKGSTTQDTSNTINNLVNAITGGETSQSTTGYNNQQQLGTTAGQTAQLQTAKIPEWLRNFVGGSTGLAGTALSTAGNLAGGYQLPQEALSALQKTAGGDYLYGGPQQQAFIDAAVRGASPGIFSQFGAAGGGGGGLQRAALDQSAIDAYAKLYQGERANQLSAATALPGITQMPFNMQAQLATLAGGLPAQFAPFLGQSNLGTSLGQTSGQTFGQTGEDIFGRTSGFSNTSTQGTTTGHATGQTTGNETVTKPIYEDPWWQTALTAGLGGLGLASSIFPASAAGKAAGGLAGGIFGGLLGSK